jgi:hypothetical protein
MSGSLACEYKDCWIASISIIITCVAKRNISRILIAENVLSLQECTLLIDLYDRYCELSPIRDYSRRPLLHYYMVRGVDSESASLGMV